MSTKNVVYLVHGGKKFYDQARMSVLTLLDHLFKQGRDDYCAVVYCDKPHWMPQHPFVRFVQLTPEQLLQWRGPLDYVHRIKLMILRAAAQELVDPFIYVDCDTRWLSLPDTEFEALNTSVADRTAQRRPAFYMHLNDGEISPQFYPNYFAHLSNTTATRLAPWHIKPGPWLMWNSGVVGVHPQVAVGLFDDALAICDLELPFLRPRLFTEQYAIALLAASRFDVRPFDHRLHHYWNYSFEAPIYLADIFAGMDHAFTVEQQADFCGRLNWDESRLKYLQDLRVNRWHRWVAKIKNSLYKRKIDVRAARIRRKQQIV